jgi:hypothetical protein
MIRSGGCAKNGSPYSGNVKESGWKRKTGEGSNLNNVTRNATASKKPQLPKKPLSAPGPDSSVTTISRPRLKNDLDSNSSMTL